MIEDLHSTCERALGNVTLAFGNPNMSSDPSESAEQSAMLANAVSQVGRDAYQKPMQEREEKEREEAFVAAERETFLNSLRDMAQELHGDRLRMALDDRNVDVTFYMNGRKLTREEAQRPFLTMYKILRGLTDSGRYRKPDEDTQKAIVDSAEEIDNLSIQYTIKRPDGSMGSYSLKSLGHNLSEEELCYLKYVHFSSLDRTDIDDIGRLRQYYASHKKEIRDKELSALCSVCDLAARRMGPPVKDPSNRTTPWSKLVAGLQKNIPGYTHPGHLPLRLNLVLPFLAQSGFVVYADGSPYNYTAQDLFLQRELPRNLRFVSTATQETYTLNEVLRNSGIASIHKDPAAFSDSVEEWYAYWNEEFKASVTLLAVEDANRQKVQQAYEEAMMNPDNVPLQLDMMERRRYEQDWIHQQSVLHRQEETRRRVLGEFSLDTSYQTMAEGLASLFNVYDHTKVAGTGIIYQDGTIMIQDRFEIVPDSNLLAQRPDQFSETAPHVWMPAGKSLFCIAPPMVVGYKAETELHLLEDIKTAAELVQQDHDHAVAQSNQRADDEQEQLRQQKAASVYGGTFG